MSRNSEKIAADRRSASTGMAIPSAPCRRRTSRSARMLGADGSRTRSRATLTGRSSYSGGRADDTFDQVARRFELGRRFPEVLAGRHELLALVVVERSLEQ